MGLSQWKGYLSYLEGTLGRIGEYVSTYIYIYIYEGPKLPAPLGRSPSPSPSLTDSMNVGPGNFQWHVDVCF